MELQKINISLNCLSGMLNSYLPLNNSDKEKYLELFKKSVFEFDHNLETASIKKGRVHQLDFSTTNLISFFQDLTDDQFKMTIFKVLGRISQIERTDIMVHALPFLARITGRKERIKILQILKYIPQNERTDVMTNALSLLESITDGKWITDILLALRCIPQGERADVVTHAPSLLIGVANGKEMADVLEVLRYIPQELRAEVVIKTIPFLTRIDGQRRANILKASVFIAPDQLKKFIAFSSLASLDFSCFEIIGDYLFNHPNYILETHTYLKEKLSIVSEQAAQRLAIEILENMSPFQLFEEHPLFQDAIKIAMDTRPLDSKNPYHVYNKLQMSSKEPMPDLSLPEERIEGKKIIISIEKFQDLVNAMKQVTFGELPELVKPKDLFDAFEKRLLDLDESTQQMILSNIEDMTDNEYPFLRDNFISDPSQFIQSLQWRGNPQDPAPLYLVFFSAIMKFIADQENEVMENGLTLREEALLRMSASIQDCPAGKKAGIALAYKLLPKAYRLSAVDAAEPSKIYLFHFVQDLLTDLLSRDSDLMQELTRASSVKQLAHQSLYVKNLIGQRIGLKHVIQFDLHTQELYTPLLERELKEVLEIFYKYFTPTFLARKLKEHIERDQLLQEKPPRIYRSLTGLPPSDKVHQLWEIDENENPTDQLTPFGVWEILKAANLLKEIEENADICRQ